MNVKNGTKYIATEQCSIILQFQTKTLAQIVRMCWDQPRSSQSMGCCSCDKLLKLAGWKKKEQYPPPRSHHGQSTCSCHYWASAKETVSKPEDDARTLYFPAAPVLYPAPWKRLAPWKDYLVHDTSLFSLTLSLVLPSTSSCVWVVYLAATRATAWLTLHLISSRKLASSADSFLHLRFSICPRTSFSFFLSFAKTLT